MASDVQAADNYCLPSVVACVARAVAPGWKRRPCTEFSYAGIESSVILRLQWVLGSKDRKRGGMAPRFWEAVGWKNGPQQASVGPESSIHVGEQFNLGGVAVDTAGSSALWRI
ncbi:hypothetical protein NDU88_005165 [Pleurodeles waltl]|uniref:Uncharacterized protein n=1 Tax=Pleurodeles waltl TaxID=8319 RepID=A0AAV7M9L1_PLEWA|nr:hypothetical protein NDU88_005165 [Pleurodeles waltl]